MRVNGGKPDHPIAWHYVYRNMRASGALSDGFNLHGYGSKPDELAPRPLIATADTRAGSRRRCYPAPNPENYLP